MENSLFSAGYSLLFATGLLGLYSICKVIFQQKTACFHLISIPILPDKLYLLGDAVYTGTGGALKLLAYRHEVMSEEAYEALPDKDANTLYLIYMSFLI